MYMSTVKNLLKIVSLALGLWSLKEVIVGICKISIIIIPEK
jgi:hypothetical protein